MKNQNVSKLLNNPMVKALLDNLRKASEEKPSEDMLLLGYTKIQMRTMQLKKPRLIWFDKASGTFYDQGDATLMKKADWYKVDKDNFKKDRPMHNLEYYVLCTKEVMQMTNQLF